MAPDLKHYAFSMIFFSAMQLANATEHASFNEDFWDYLIEFSDEDGELFDPVDFSSVNSSEDSSNETQFNEQERVNVK